MGFVLPWNRILVIVVIIVIFIIIIILFRSKGNCIKIKKGLLKNTLNKDSIRVFNKYSEKIDLNEIKDSNRCLLFIPIKNWNATDDNTIYDTETEEYHLLENDSFFYIQDTKKIVFNIKPPFLINNIDLEKNVIKVIIE
jgi:aminopeptidase C